MHTTALLCLLSGRQTIFATKMSQVKLNSDFQSSALSSASDHDDVFKRGREIKLEERIADKLKYSQSKIDSKLLKFSTIMQRDKKLESFIEIKKSLASSELFANFKQGAIGSDIDRPIQEKGGLIFG